MRSYDFNVRTYMNKSGVILRGCSFWFWYEANSNKRFKYRVRLDMCINAIGCRFILQG